jgi:aminoacyl tRNA synthase complex-interacting multifunctional protein 1
MQVLRGLRSHVTARCATPPSAGTLGLASEPPGRSNSGGGGSGKQHAVAGPPDRSASSADAGPAATSPPAPVFDIADDTVISCLDIRVGFIEEARAHPDADKLYIEAIALGEASGARQICSGLVPFLSLAEVSGPCIVLANLQPRKLQGVMSNGMVLVAQSQDGSEGVQLLRPPAAAPPGERVRFEGLSDGTAASPRQLSRKAGKRALEAILTGGDLCTNVSCEGSWRGRRMLTSAGPVVVDSLVGAPIN